MGRHAVTSLKTCCGMGSCDKRFRSVATALRHVVTHRPIIGPRGKDEPIWKVAWTRAGEIREVLSGPLPNLPIHEGENAPAAPIAAYRPSGVSGYGAAE